jgi:hypothetical protein
VDDVNEPIKANAGLECQAEMSIRPFDQYDFIVAILED